MYTDDVTHLHIRLGLGSVEHENALRRQGIRIWLQLLDKETIKGIDNILVTILKIPGYNTFYNYAAAGHRAFFPGTLNVVYRCYVFTFLAISCRATDTGGKQQNEPAHMLPFDDWTGVSHCVE